MARTRAEEIARHAWLAGIQGGHVYEISAVRGLKQHTAIVHAKDEPDARRQADCMWRTSHRGGVWHSHNAVLLEQE